MGGSERSTFVLIHARGTAEDTSRCNSQAPTVAMHSIKSYFRPAGSQRPQNAASRTSPAPLTPPRQDDAAPLALRDLGLPLPSQVATPRASQATSRPDSQGWSRPGSAYQNPFGDVETHSLLQLKAGMMVEYVWQQQRRNMWSMGQPGEGVILKMARGEYVCAPRSLANELNGFYDAVRAMNVRVSS